MIFFNPYIRKVIFFILGIAFIYFGYLAWTEWPMIENRTSALQKIRVLEDESRFRDEDEARFRDLAMVAEKALSKIREVKP